MCAFTNYHATTAEYNKLKRHGGSGVYWKVLRLRHRVGHKNVELRSVVQDYIWNPGLTPAQVSDYHLFKQSWAGWWNNYSKVIDEGIHVIKTEIGAALLRRMYNPGHQYVLVPVTCYAVHLLGVCHFEGEEDCVFQRVLLNQKDYDEALMQKEKE